MMKREASNQCTVAISISDSPDMASLGLSDGHLSDAMVEVARHLLSIDVNLVYGGDLRAYGFSDHLFELVARYKPYRANSNEQACVTNFLAWPVHIQLPVEKLEATVDELAGSAKIVCLDIEGVPMTLEDRKKLPVTQPTEDEWCRGLTFMRRYMLAQTDARIILGGRLRITMV